MSNFIASEPVVRFLAEENVSAYNRRVFIETPLTIEKGEALSFAEPGDDDYDPSRTNDRPYISWGVWDHRTEEWARVGNDDASHFDTRNEAQGWVIRNLSALLSR